jgi:Raf kinase inhibitor-like YbhB/YbcL family protein
MQARPLRRLISNVGLACIFQSVGVAALHAALAISSPAFTDGQPIPAKYARLHANISPALEVAGAPAPTRSFVLIVDDPDAPGGLFTHWLLWDLPPNVTGISAEGLPPGAKQGRNSFGDVHYDGPKPPSGTHRYFFHLYALDRRLDLPAGAGRVALETAMKDHIIGRAELMGTFSAGQ